jgi:hypothetical protein
MFTEQSGYNLATIRPTIQLIIAIKQGLSDNKRYKIRYEMMTCNGKAISKVMGWGMILKMIRDKKVT